MTTRNKTVKIWSTVKFILLVVAICAITVAIAKSWTTTKTLAQEVMKLSPEVFTELYFSEHTTLPIVAEPEKSTPFSFVVHNKEEKTVNYIYEIYLTDNLTRKMIKKGEFSLINKQKTTIPAEFTLEKGSGKAEISVWLVNKNQEISFWVEEARI